jgi:hypothetical protein
VDLVLILCTNSRARFQCVLIFVHEESLAYVFRNMFTTNWASRFQCAEFCHATIECVGVLSMPKLRINVCKLSRFANNKTVSIQVCVCF